MNTSLHLYLNTCVYIHWIDIFKHLYCLIIGTMMFVDLVDEDTAGVPWTTVMQDKLCSRWAAMLQHGSLTAHVYNVSDKQLLVSTMKAWLMKDILKFVITQPEVGSKFEI